MACEFASTSIPARLYESSGSFCCHPDVCIGVSVGVTLENLTTMFLCDDASYPV